MSVNHRPKYLRVSLLSACNLRCTYCRPSGERPSKGLVATGSLRSAIRFLYGAGIRKIRFTGGEPTLFKDLPDLVSFVKEVDQEIHTALTSNGVLLESQAQALSAAGLDTANISLDTLDPVKFQSLTGSDLLDRVVSGIDAAAEHVGNVKLNCVIMRGVNDNEADKLISFADSRGLDIRFIEFMPNRFSTPGDPRFISSKDIRDRLPWDFRVSPGKPNSAARYYTAPTLRIRVGFISPVSHPFCGGCDRIRLTADGLLYTCLYDSNRINLFELLAADYKRARAEFTKLVQSKQFRGCRDTAGPTAIRPSFSAMGG